jgi:hypothetical protein
MSTAAIGLATPAQAAIKICEGPGCVQPDSNVLFATNNEVGTSINATLNDNPSAIITFNGNETLTGANSNGQARVDGLDGDLTFLEILLGGGATEIEFNLNALAAGEVTLSFFGMGNVLLDSDTFDIDASGQNFFGAFDALITRVTIDSTVQLGDVRQVRITGANMMTGVPEPTTWAMMLIGFGAIGVGMRRRRRQTAFMQMA